MPPNSEIEKLERRWKENPKGTVFAPYAEVLRKHGDYPMAKDILRMGLELHPDHIPGNIVLGRCCLDLGEEGPAEAAFVHVLDLDIENVIALKALAEITERQGRLMESASWLARLIAVDPSNDEAREQLTRVEAAREAASAALVEPTKTRPVPILTADTSVSSFEDTEPITVIQPPTPPALEMSRTEVASGRIGSEPAPSLEPEDAINALLGAFDPPPPPALVSSDSDTTERVPVLPRPVPTDSSPPMLDLDLTPDEPFRSPPPPLQTYSLGAEVAPSIEISPSLASEFQSSDDSSALLDLSPSSGSEFQAPDAAAELSLSIGAGFEYQTPSGAEDLLASVESSALLTPDRPPPEPPPEAPPITSGFAAIGVMKTEELPTSPDQVKGESPSGAEPAAPVSVVDMLAALAGPSVEQATASQGIRGNAGPPHPGTDLPLIFPDEMGEPEPPRIRVISEEITPPAREPSEPPTLEPAPVLTETMAELYARQGHLGEALNVYRALAAREPGNSRIAARIQALEAQLAAGRRRMSYVAVDTGGESVGSFFRALGDARPVAGSAGAEPAPGRASAAIAAPTRPASDPLSLSAIFGEDPASRPSGPTESPPMPDSYSFDQFFMGGTQGGGSGAQSARPPGDDDLDQFQNWLKSLKR